jgi:hypothetical protein
MGNIPGGRGFNSGKNIRWLVFGRNGYIFGYISIFLIYCNISLPSVKNKEKLK